MTLSRARRIRRLAQMTLGAATAVLVAGCSALTFTYNHVEGLLLWRIDRYFHLSHEQEGLLQGRLAELHVWHRKAELPRYVDFLSQVQDRWRDGLTPEDVDWTFDAFEKLRAELADHVAAEGAAFLATVDAKQIRYLERAIQRENRDLQAEASAKPEKRSAKRVNKALNWLDEWLGRLTPEQEQRIAQLIREMPDNTEQRLAHRIQRQHEFMRLLESKPKPTVIEHSLQEWLATPKKNAPRAYALSVQHMRDDLKQTVLAIDRIVTPRQRAHASEKLQTLIREVQALAAS